MMSDNNVEKHTFAVDPHTREILEFDFVLEEVAAYCYSEEGARLLFEQPFYQSDEEIDRVHAKVHDLRRIMESGDETPDLAFPAITGAFEGVVKEGTSLEGSTLRDIAYFLSSAKRFANFALQTADEKTHSTLEDDLAEMPDLSEVIREVRHYIDDDGLVRESLPGISSIIRRLKESKAAVSSRANAYLHEKQELWQTDVPTERDGRTVLPMKADRRGGVRGIVRDVSPSGATVYIEPEDIVERNNAVFLLEHEYRAEAAKILRTCTRSVRAHLDEIRLTIDLVAWLDTLYARARYSHLHQCVAPESLGAGVRLKQARHPLLGNRAVPIDLEMPEGKRILVVTGPNAGGKTVALKTIGLFVLMNQFGLPIPASEWSAIDRFDSVYADIGDEQSIQESLSTFSGHMSNIGRFIERANRDSLVLLDELGSGTDPEEGSAIAMAILDSFIEKNATVVVTTHHGVLKNFGYSREEAVNASVAFDTETHKPTYRVVMGLPGESHAFDIAASSGIGRNIIEKSERYMDEHSTDISSIIRSISEKQHELEQQESDLEQQKNELNKKLRETDLHALRVKQREVELQSQGYRELTKQIEEYRSKLENLVRDLKSEGVDREKTREVKEYIGNMEKTAERQREQILEKKQELTPVETIEPGMDVYVGKSKQRGTVVRKAKKGYWLIATDKLKITVPEYEIRGVAEKSNKKPQISVSRSTLAEKPSYQLDVRGERLEEAVDAVSRQIDKALIANMHEFEIIHGHGEGILKRGIHDYLETSDSVTDFRFADPEQGGFGKTIVKIK